MNRWGPWIYLWHSSVNIFIYIHPSPLVLCWKEDGLTLPSIALLWHLPKPTSWELCSLALVFLTYILTTWYLLKQYDSVTFLTTSILNLFSVSMKLQLQGGFSSFGEWLNHHFWIMFAGWCSEDEDLIDVAMEQTGAFAFAWLAAFKVFGRRDHKSLPYFFVVPNGEWRDFCFLFSSC